MVFFENSNIGEWDLYGILLVFLKKKKTLIIHFNYSKKIEFIWISLQIYKRFVPLCDW